MEHALFVILATIAISTALNVMLKKIDIPTVIGYVFTGVIITSLFSFGTEQKEVLSHLAEFGIVFLMFTVGLEFSFKHLKSMKYEVFVNGGLQMFVTGAVLSLGGHFIFGLESKTATVIGMSLALSSTAIVLKMLNENGDIHAGYGKTSLGILLFQDLAVIPILLMVSFFSSDDQSVSSMIMNTLGGAVVVFFVMFIFGKYLAERFFNFITQSKSEEIFLVSVMLVVISASVFAETVGFTYSLGAFLSGMVLAETKYRYRIEADLVPFRDILLGIFFITIGMLIKFESVIEYATTIVAITFIIMTTKGIILYLVMKKSSPKRTSVKTALSLFQIGEFALAVFALAGSKGIIPEEVNQVLIVSIVLSMIITPFVINNIRKLTDIVAIEPILEDDILPIVSGTYHNHIIVCGYGSLGASLVEKLKSDGSLYVILEHDGTIVNDVLKKGKEPIFLANSAQKSIFEHFNSSQAKAIIVTIENERQRRLVCENIIATSPDVYSVVKVNNSYEEDYYTELGMSSVINEKNILGSILHENINNLYSIQGSKV